MSGNTQAVAAAADVRVLRPKIAVVRATRIPELDGVRGLAIAFVVLFHYFNINIPGHKIFWYLSLPTRQMWSGVDLFFVLSGLLIGGILLDHRDSSTYYATFYARRLYRIFPLYYLMVAALLAGRLAFPNSPLFRGAIPWWTYPLFAQNLVGSLFTYAPPFLGATWSLAVEEQFYLLLPAIVRLCSKKTLLALVMVCIAGAPCLRTLLVIRGAVYEQIYALLPCRADALAFGVLAAIMLRSEGARAWVRDKARVLYGCLLLLYLALPGLLKWKSYTYLNTVSLTFFDAMYFLLILLLLVAPLPQLKAFFNLAGLRRLGTLSYCVYLIHSPILQGLFLLSGLGAAPEIRGWKTLAITLSALGLTLLLARISWSILEQPLIKRAHSLHRYQWPKVASEGSRRSH